MQYIKSKKYSEQRFMDMIMGPNPIKLCEELLASHQIAAGARVCDLGSGQGLGIRKSNPYCLSAAIL